MLATRQSLRSVRLLCRRPLLSVPRPQLRLQYVFRSFATAPRAAQKLDSQTDEEYVRTVREEWGDNLPEGLLTQGEFVLYERYYGKPVRMLKEGENPLEELEDAEKEEVDAPGTVTLQDKDGVSIEMFEEEVESMDSVTIDINNPLEAKAYEQLQRDMERAFREERLGEELDEEFNEREEGEEEEGEGEYGLAFGDDGSYAPRSHPLTSIGRFGTFPSTIQVPPSIQLPTMESLSNVPNKHLDEAAHRILGGPGLPDSPVFKNKGGKTLRDVWLNVEDGRMNDIASEVFLATVMPGYYAQTLSALTELRRRLGGDWVLGHEGEGGVKNVLDVGSGGAGILAWKSIMEAEYTRRRDEARQKAGETEIEPEQDTAETLTAATANLKASVVTASDSLRHRVSKFLDNTTFLPRLPDRNPDNVFHTPSKPRISFSPNPKQPRKLYDLIIATNNLLPVHESHNRRERIRKLWSHLNPDGGILLLIEKGTPLGFEAIAGARSTLLRTYISSPGSETRPIGGNTGLSIDNDPIEKEYGAIIAPCTNHTECPMFVKGYTQGVGRRDWCHFIQRYERPTYLQRIMGVSSRNHEDLLYSYVAVRRGVDYRRGEEPIAPKISEFEIPKARGEPTKSPYSMEQLRRFAFTLPRTILPPLKRHGHIILDVCTTKGNIERWTVPKSLGKVEFRDARKSRWGDLWALDAKTKVSRNIKIGNGQSIPKKRITNEYNEDGRVGKVERKSWAKHWSRGEKALGEGVQRKVERKRHIRWAAQRKEMEGEIGESY